MKETELIDFSPCHEKFIQNPDGSFSRMDEPWFEAEKIGEGTWKILSSGDFSYLVEGENEAFAIDTGYGAGNIRAYMQGLTKKKVRYVINTHDHFDHTAGNGYFEKAFMSRETAPLATRPFRSFAGITFPADYPKEIVGEGDVLDPGNRPLEVFLIPDHAPGSIALLDRKGRFLFVGDEFMPDGKRLKGSLWAFSDHVEKLMAHRHEFDFLCAGAGVYGGELLERYQNCLSYIASGHEGEIPADEEFSFPVIAAPGGGTAYHRQFPHPEDIPVESEAEKKETRKFLRWVEHDGVAITYDIRLGR